MSELKVELLNEGHAEQWDALVDKTPQGTMYHEWMWVALLRKHMPAENVQVYGCFLGEQLVGGCTLRADRKMTLRMALKPWATHYYGTIVDAKAQVPADRIVRAILEHLESRFDLIHLIHSPTFDCIDPYREAGFELGERRTLIFPTGDEETMWQKLTHDARNASRRAIREGVRVVKSQDVELLRRLYWNTYERQDVTIHFTPEIFEAVCAEIINADRGGLWVAFDAYDRPCVAVLMGWDKKRAYGLFSGSDYQFSRNGSGSLLWWEIFMALAARFPEVDMVGEGTPTTPGIKRFKMQFRPNVAPMHETKRFSSLSARLRWQVLDRLRSIKKASCLIYKNASQKNAGN